MLNRLTLNRAVFKSKLARKVSLWVFASVVAIELVILIPSYQRRRQDLLQTQVEKVQKAFLPLIQQHRQQPSQAIKPLNQRLANYPNVVGVRLSAWPGPVIHTGGESLQRSPAIGGPIVVAQAAGPARHEVAWPVSRPDGDLVLALRLNTQQVQTQLNHYTLRIFGLIVLISAVVTATTMYTVSILVIKPVLLLCEDVLRGGDMMTVEDYDFNLDVKQRQRGDELGELFLVFESLFERVRLEIFDRHRIEASLASETLITQQAQKHSAELQQVLRELRGTQAQLIHSEKMSSLGQLVAGIAHEFNNPVSFIHGNLKPLQQYVDSLLELICQYQLTYPDSPENLQQLAAAIDLEYIQADLPKILASMGNGTCRIRTIVNSLRSFSRLDESVMKQVDVHEGLNSTLMLLQHRFNATTQGIQLQKDYGELPLIECFANQLNQVFLSLLDNAIDAIAMQNEPGQITLRTSQIRPGWIQILIRDNGPGISPTALPQVFDPFFTTKPVGQGAGLGLSVSYQIIQMHGGNLHCYSGDAGSNDDGSSAPHGANQRGATFTIEIPIAQSSVFDDAPPAAAAALH